MKCFKMPSSSYKSYLKILSTDAYILSMYWSGSSKNMDKKVTTFQNMQKQHDLSMFFSKMSKDQNPRIWFFDFTALADFDLPG